MRRSYQIRGLTIFEAVLAVAFLGITIAFLSYGALSGHRASVKAANSLAATQILASEIGHWKPNVKSLSEEPQFFKGKTSSFSYQGEISSQLQEDSKRLYELKAKISWKQGQHEQSIEEKVLVRETRE